MQKFQQRIPFLCRILTIASLLLLTHTLFITHTLAAKKINENELKKQIEKAEETYNVQPIEAKIDPVWKLRPGLEGRSVDVEKSLKVMKEKGEFSNKHLQFQSLPPKINMKSLQPAPIYKGLEEKRMVAFTINVAWGEEHLPSILATLERHNVHATFFIEGKWAEKNEQLVKKIVNKGHEVGNHSYSHADMKVIPTEKIKEEIIKTNNILQKSTNKPLLYFAPPSGSFRDETIRIAKELGMFTTLWTVDTIDWQKPHPSTIVSRIKNKIHSGAIVLMHPTEPTAKALEECIQYVLSKGLTIGTVNELLSEKRDDR